MADSSTYEVVVDVMFFVVVSLLFSLIPLLSLITRVSLCDVRSYGRRVH